MNNNTVVNKCKHCGDPIYKFQAVAHEGCVAERVNKWWIDWIGKNELKLYWRTISTTGKDYYIPLCLADTWQALKKPKKD